MRKIPQHISRRNEKPSLWLWLLSWKFDEKYQNTKQTSSWILQRREMILGSCFIGKSLQVMEGGAAFNDGRISVGDRLVVVKNRRANFNISYFPQGPTSKLWYFVKNRKQANSNIFYFPGWSSRTNKQTLIFSIFQAGRRQEPAHWRLLFGQLHPRGERAGD